MTKFYLNLLFAALSAPAFANPPSTSASADTLHLCPDGHITETEIATYPPTLEEDCDGKPLVQIPLASFETPSQEKREEQSEHSWHLLCVSEGGKINLLKGLTKHEADYTHDRMLGLPATLTEKARQHTYDVTVKRVADEEERAQDDFIRAHSPRCPAGASRALDGGAIWKAWEKQHENDYIIDSTNGTALPACVRRDGSINYYWEFVWSGAGDQNGPLPLPTKGHPILPHMQDPPNMPSAPKLPPASMKSCEVFK